MQQRLRGHFRPEWKMSLFVAVMLPLLIALGLWQLERAAFKRDLEAAWYDSVGSLPVAPQQLASAPRDGFVRVRLTGRYDAERQFLLDNRTHRGAAGYHVVTPFVTSTGTYFVNRGWVAAGSDRSTLPALPVPAGDVTIIGQRWPETGDLILLGADPWDSGWPKRVQRLDFERMTALLDAGQTFEIRIEPGQPGALTVERTGADFNAPRHVGYALQWFGLAAVLAVGFVYYSIRGAREHTQQR